MANLLETLISAKRPSCQPERGSITSALGGLAIPALVDKFAPPLIPKRIWAEAGIKTTRKTRIKEIRNIFLIVECFIYKGFIKCTNFLYYTETA